MESEPERANRSIVWQLFTKKNNELASCNTCKKDFIYKNGTSNLYRHWKNVHIKKQDNDTTDCSDGDWSDNSDNISKTVKEALKKTTSSSKSTWQYFDVQDSDKFVAKCRVCDKDVSYDAVSDLTEHIREHNLEVSDDDAPVSGKKSKRRSRVWKYMKILDKSGRNALCLICGKTLSYMTSISNLAKHLRRAHPHVSLVADNEEEQAQKILISANGQLYEIEASDTEKDPINTDEVYLEDTVNDVTYEDTYQKATPPKKIQKIYKKTIKRNHSSRQQIRTSIDNNTSSDDDTPKRRTTKMSCLDYFGQYVISLLKDMPKHISEQLQGSIIKQIMDAKIALQVPYSVSLTDKPLTVNLSNSQVESVAEITIQENGDNSTIQNGVIEQ